MNAADDIGDGAVVAFFIAPDDSTSIIAQHKCTTCEQLHTDRLALGPTEGRYIAEFLLRLVTTIGFAYRSESVDDLVDLKESVQQTVRDL